MVFSFKKILNKHVNFKEVCDAVHLSISLGYDKASVYNYYCFDFFKDTCLYVGSNYETCYIKVNTDEFALWTKKPRRA